MTVPSPGASARISRSGAALLAAGAALLILAARLHGIAKHGTPVPFWDEWDPDVIGIFLPPASGHPGLAALLAPHNGHRIVLTRLLSLALFRLQGGQWDILTNVVLNQIAFSVFAGMWLVWLASFLRFWPQLAMLAAGIAILANPFGWQAQTWAFESQIYLCVMLSVAAFALLARAGPDRPSFWCGIVCACLSVLSFGAGLATLLAAASLVALRDLPGKRRLRAATALLVLAAVGAALVAATDTAGVSLHHPAGAVIHVMLRVLSWPRGPGSLALAYLPALIVISHALLRPASRDRLAWFATAICVWEAALAGQIALARFDDPITPRYTEFLVLGLVVNLTCALLLWQLAQRAKPAWQRLGAGAALLLWCGMMTAGFHLRAPALAMELAAKRVDDDRQATTVARYLKTADPSLLFVPGAIPYHTPDRLGAMLRQGKASRIFEPALWQGDTLARDTWRKPLSRWATVLAILGALFLAPPLQQRTPKAKVFWFFFSKKNTLPSS